MTGGTTDEDLMRRFQSGSREAFQELFARYHAPINGFFRRRVNDGRAEDLTQETFLAVIKAIGRYRPEATVRTYLYGIAIKLVYAERRKRSTGSIDGDYQMPDEHIDDALWIRQALAKLDEQERDILMLREYEQLSYDEIAHLLGVPLNTVRSRLFRARLALKNHLRPVEAA